MYVDSPGGYGRCRLLADLGVSNPAAEYETDHYRQAAPAEFAEASERTLRRNQHAFTNSGEIRPCLVLEVGEKVMTGQLPRVVAAASRGSRTCSGGRAFS